MDAQTELRGQRIDMVDIDSTLAAHPLVDRAAVAVLGEASEHLLAGYAVERMTETLTGGELRRHTARALPAALVPDLFVVVDRLPVDPSGEVDRPALARATRGGDRDGEAPAIIGGVAAQIADIWREVLTAAAVTLTDDLFDLGAHSLTVTRIATRIRSRIGVDVPLEVFYDTPTLAAVAAAVEQLGDSDGSGPA